MNFANRQFVYKWKKHTKINHFNKISSLISTFDQLYRFTCLMFIITNYKGLFFLCCNDCFYCSNDGTHI